MDIYTKTVARQDIVLLGRQSGPVVGNKERPEEGGAIRTIGRCWRKEERSDALGYV